MSRSSALGGEIQNLFPKSAHLQIQRNADRKISLPRSKMKSVQHAGRQELCLPAGCAYSNDKIN
jgi:hypothetical protein